MVTTVWAGLVMGYLAQTQELDDNFSNTLDGNDGHLRYARMDGSER